MAVQPNIVSEAELAKNNVINSPLDDDVKRNLITLITKSATATNGITQEEKVQALTECMAALASALGSYMSYSDRRLKQLEDTYATEHPESKLEQIQKFEKQLAAVENYRNLNGIKPNVQIDGKDIIQALKDNTELKSQVGNSIQVEDSTGIADKILAIFKLPYVWIFATVAICSPYAADILTKVVSAFSK